MRKVITIIFIIVCYPCFSQVDEFFNDLKNTSESDYQRFDSIQSIPKGTLNIVKKSLPDRKRMPLVSYSEYLSSIKTVDNFLSKHVPRIFEYAFEYRNYVIIHYYLKVGPSRMPLIVVTRMNKLNKVDLIIFLRSWDFSSLDKFHSFKRIGKRIYLEEVTNGNSYY